MTIYDADGYQIHDRYWINETNKKILNVGTSLNGLGKQLSTINILNSNDSNGIISSISSINNPF